MVIVLLQTEYIYIIKHIAFLYLISYSNVTQKPCQYTKIDKSDITLTNQFVYYKLFI